MRITEQQVADRLTAYLQGRSELADLVDWAEHAMMEEEFESTSARDVTARPGLADVRAFGLTWEDCRRLLADLGYSARVEVVA